MTVRVAIACQGGGSHTAFTAGALKAVLEAQPASKPFEIVALSGTSGGAICALLAWYGLIQHGRPDSGPLGGGETVDGRIEAAALLSEFWTREWPDGNATRPSRAALAAFVDEIGSEDPRRVAARLLDSIRNDVVQTVGPWLANPAFALNVEINPYFVADMVDLASARTRRPLNTLRRLWDVQLALKELLATYVDFDDAKRTATAANGFLPALQIGAVDVLAGDFKVFSSQAAPGRWPGDGITADAVVASAALPTLMRAVRVGDSVFWDGLFSQNPPIHDLPDVHADRFPEHNPDEIWIVRINPQRRSEEPRSTVDIHDRRNELAGNLSLRHEIRSIEKINDLLADGVLRDDGNARRYKHVEIREIEMSPDLARRLDPVTKLDRKADFIETLIADGEARATAALKAWGYV